MKGMKRPLTLAGVLALFSAIIAATFLLTLWATPQSTKSPTITGGEGKPSQQPGPPVSWSPDHLVVTLSPGETKVVHATATISADIPATFTWVVPELVPYVTVQPSSLPASGASSTQNFDVSISIPEGTPFSTVEGTVQLRTPIQSGAATRNRNRKQVFRDRDGIARAAEQPGRQAPALARPLPILLNIWPVVVSTDLGIRFNTPPQFEVKFHDGENTITIGPPGDTAPNSQRPLIIINAEQNPTDLGVQEYFDGEPGEDLLGQSQGLFETRSVGPIIAYEFVTLSGSISTVVPVAGKFIVVTDIGSAFQHNGTFDTILNSVVVF
jgi:hypothetical protein